MVDLCFRVTCIISCSYVYPNHSWLSLESKKVRAGSRAVRRTNGTSLALRSKSVSLFLASSSWLINSCIASSCNLSFCLSTSSFCWRAACHACIMPFPPSVRLLSAGAQQLPILLKQHLPPYPSVINLVQYRCASRSSHFICQKHTDWGSFLLVEHYLYMGYILGCKREGICFSYNNKVFLLSIY